MSYEIFCILYDDNNPFSVDMNETQTVSSLQKAIKMENSDLATFDAHKLTLYHIDATSIEDVKRKSQTLSRLKRLEAFDELSEVFRSGPPKKRIHILVMPPAGDPINSRVCGVVAETVLSPPAADSVIMPATIKLKSALGQPRMYKHFGYLVWFTSTHPCFTPRPSKTSRSLRRIRRP